MQSLRLSFIAAHLHHGTSLSCGTQEKQEDLSKVVGHIKKEYGLDFVYCWHALHAYWSGVSPSAAGTKPYGSQITHPVPTPGAC